MVNKIIQTLTLNEYQKLINDCPRPSDEQVEAFVQFMANEHSWYKHLATPPLANPFFFFINPSAGHNVMEDLNGKITVTERTANDSFKFHHTWMTTRDFNKRYASCSYIRSKSKLKDERCYKKNYDPQGVHFYGLDGKGYSLPEEVLEAGFIALDRVIHPYSAQDYFIGELIEETVSWPEKAGGQAQLNKIRDRLKILQSTGDISASPDSVLMKYLEPARNLQLENIRKTINRVINIAHLI